MAVISKPIIVQPLPLVNITASTAEVSKPAFHLGRHNAPGLTWRATGTGHQWLNGEFGGARSIDFLAVIGMSAASAMSVMLRLGDSTAQVDGSLPAYSSGTLPFVSTAPAVAPEDGLYHSFLRLPSPVSATHWRIDFQQTGISEASAIVLGRAIEPSHFYNPDYEHGIEDLGEFEISPWGVLDEQPGLVWRTLDFTLGWQSEVEFETTFRPLMRAIGSRGVVYCCFDPTDSPYRQARTYMGPLRRPLFARGSRKPRTVAQEFSILSFI